jgi:hypothetical protein
LNCPPGFTLRTVTVNAAGGKETLFTCVQ